MLPLAISHLEIKSNQDEAGDDSATSHTRHRCGGWLGPAHHGEARIAQMWFCSFMDGTRSVDARSPRLLKRRVDLRPSMTYLSLNV